ncbi:glycosyltransferase [Chloroflexota bacterium]
MIESNRIAFIHDWLTTLGGGEQIMASWWEIWPEAPAYTLVYDPYGPCGSFTSGKNINTSFIQKLPRAKSNHRAYLPLMPLAVEQFDVRDYEIIISSSHATAHGVLIQPDQLHINYVHTPMRYAWHLYHQYLEESGLQKGLKGWCAKFFLHYLRLWDVSTSNRVDEYVANSNWTAQNIWRVYRRHAEVINPPVDVNSFEIFEKKEKYYVTISRLVAYKRVDMIIEAFKDLPDRKLIVVGDGPDLAKMRSIATENVEFLGFLPFNEMNEVLGKARALVYAAVEDFGIVPLEAQACGTPVIAYGKGGVLETVLEGETGFFYRKQNPESLVKAIQTFEAVNYELDIQTLRENAERFSKEGFQKQFALFVEQKWESFSNSSRLRD